MHKSIFLGLLPALALATPAFRLRRDDELAAQDCTQVPGYKACGLSCILETDSCCPDNSGGCPAGSYCSLGDNQEYGCCPEGKVCGGDGGVTTGTVDFTSTSTSTLEVTLTEEASSTVTEETTSTTSAEVVVTETSTGEEPTATVSASSVEPSSAEASASAASSSATAYTTSTIYTTTIHTITSCPATHPCTAGASTPVILVTETVAVSTTICPVVESPPLPTPTGTATAVPVPKPSVICPGGGKNCFSVSSSAVAVPTKSATGTGGYHVPSPTGKPVTAGAGKATFGLAAVVAAFAALL